MKSGLPCARLEDLLAHLFGNLDVDEQPANKRFGVVFRQGTDDERGPAVRPIRPELEQLLPGQAEDHHRDILRPAGEIFDEVEQRAIRPVQVLEDENEWFLLGQSLEEHPQRPLKVFACRISLGDPNGLNHPLRYQVRVIGGPEQLRDRGTRVFAGRLMNNLRERPERDSPRRRGGIGRSGPWPRRPRETSARARAATSRCPPARAP